MTQKPKIFLTNDDGIHSPGLRAAVQAVMHLGEVVVVAPSNQQTGMGRGFTGNMDASLAPVKYEINGQSIQAFHYEGSPALVVHHGLNVLFPQKMPDLIVSGINYGENLGTNVTASGTVGAALEGASRGIVSIAISLQTEKGAYFHYSDRDWDVASHFLTTFAKPLLKHTLPFDVDLLKIDVPHDATLETPWRLTCLSRQPYYTSFLEAPSLASTPRDAIFDIHLIQDILEPESDIYALVVDQVVSVTPLSLNCTSRADFGAIHSVLTANGECA